MQFPKQIGILTMYLGRISFPLFAFITVEGYLHTSNFKKYITRLFILGIISQIPFMLFRTLIDPGVFTVNIIGTLILGLLAIYAFDKSKNKIIGMLIAIVMIIIGHFINVDYGWYGVGMVLLIYLTKDKKVLFPISYIAYISVYYITTYMKFDNSYAQNINILKQLLPYIAITTVPMILMKLYNGKLGKKIKYFFYIFYPAHLIIVYIISRVW